MRKKIIIAVCSILILIFLFMAFVFFSNSRMGENIYLFGRKPIILVSAEFEPDIRENSILWVEKVEPEDRKDIKKGDIVLYDAFVYDTKVKVCGEVFDAEKGNLTVGTDIKKETRNTTISTTEVTDKSIGVWNWASFLFGPVVKLIY